MMNQSIISSIDTKKNLWHSSLQPTCIPHTMKQTIKTTGTLIQQLNLIVN